MELTVKVKINDDLLRSYLAGLFDRREGGYIVNMGTLTGAAICSLVKQTDYPSATDDDHTTVTFHLSKSHYNDSLRSKCLCVTKEAEAKINACLREEFETKFLYFCAEARLQGYMQKDIIPIFMLKNKIDFYDGDIDAPKKRLYRKELSLYENIEKKLRRKVYLSAQRVLKTMSEMILG